MRLTIQLRSNQWRPIAFAVARATCFTLFFQLGVSIACAQTPIQLDDSEEHSTSGVTKNDSVIAILRSRCGACHGPEESEGELRTDSREYLLLGGISGPAIIPGSPKESHLVRLIRSTDVDQQMPPKDPLLPRQIEMIEEWIADGALWPESMSPENSTRNLIVERFGGERLDLWSLQPPDNRIWLSIDIPEMAAVPEVIDRLVDQQLAEVKLSMSPPADPRTLIRRLSFDLTGLPPSHELVARYQKDPSEENYRSIVDSLLSSVDYGKHQASTWLDIVRYADTEGYERDEFRPNIWRYRDYVIHSFNQDKPYDQFVHEQLAGDEHFDASHLNTDQVERLTATGYLRLGQWDSTASIFQEEERLRSEMLADLTNTTASAFLGLTFSCCQCHDHKYDPFAQEDHYRLASFFSTMRSRDEVNLGLSDDHGEIVISAVEDAPDDSAPVKLLYQGDFRSPRQEVAPGFVSVLYPGPATITPTLSGSSGNRTALANWITSPENPWTARVIVNRIWQQHFGVGLVSTPNDFGFSGSKPSNPQLLDTLSVAIVRDGWSLKNLHRAIVLSKTYRQSSDIHAVTEISSATDLHDVKANFTNGVRSDPQNRLLWRQNPRRLSAESVRDAMLSAAGMLQPKSGGPPVWPPVPEELLNAQPAILEALEGKDDGRKQGWYTDPTEATYVRSIYLIRKRCLPIPMLQVFDLPDSTVSCARRDQTIVAPQALSLLNSEFSVRVAEHLSEKLLMEEKTPRDLNVASIKKTSDIPIQTIVSRGFQRVLQRPPSPEEAALSQEFLLKQYQMHLDLALSPDDAMHDATVDFCRAMLNLNEFIYID